MRKLPKGEDHGALFANGLPFDLSRCNMRTVDDLSRDLPDGYCGYTRGADESRIEMATGVAFDAVRREAVLECDLPHALAFDDRAVDGDMIAVETHDTTLR